MGRLLPRLFFRMKITYESGFRKGFAVLLLTPESHAEHCQLRELEAKANAAGIPLIRCSDDWDSMSQNSVAAHLSYDAIPESVRVQK